MYRGKKRKARSLHTPRLLKQVTKYPCQRPILRNTSHFAKQGDGLRGCL